jgi:hypothetical protein
MGTWRRDGADYSHDANEFKGRTLNVWKFEALKSTRNLGRVRGAVMAQRCQDDSEARQAFIGPPHPHTFPDLFVITMRTGANNLKSNTRLDTVFFS